jgi:hypothetical protein
LAAVLCILDGRCDLVLRLASTGVATAVVAASGKPLKKEVFIAP